MLEQLINSEKIACFIWPLKFFTTCLLLFSSLANSAPYSLEYTYSPRGDTLFYQKDPDLAIYALPVEILNEQLKQELERISTPEIKIWSAKGSGFFNPLPGSDKFTLRARIDATGYKDGVSVDFNCQIDVSFYIPAALLPKMSIVPAGNVVDCQIPNDFMRPFLLDKLKEMAGRDLPLLIAKRVIPSETLNKLMNGDPNVASLLSKGYVAGSYCVDSHSRVALCLNIGWLDNKFSNTIETIIKDAPISLGYPDTSNYAVRRQELRENSPRKSVGQNYKFPAGLYDEDGWEIGDMSIFGGLLCLSGEEEGCQLIKCSQTNNGQFWRSPANINENAEIGHSPFSGDQFKGVVAFFLGNKLDTSCPLDSSNTVVTNPERLANYLSYIAKNIAFFPLDFGYKSCKEVEPNQTCLFAGNEWFWLNFLSQKEHLPIDSIPYDSRNVKERYGFDWSFLEMQATLAPLGFELHLVGVQVFLAEEAGIEHPAVKRSAAILASRQPKNPFYLYLHLGRDKRVSNELNNTCFINVPTGKRGDWSWQRDSSEEAWKRSMGWDCVFMFNLMLN